MAALTGALLALSAAGTAMNVIGQRKAAKAAKKQAAYEGHVADEQAADAVARGEEAASQSGAASRQLTGSQRAAFAAQGVDIGSGSAADVIASDQHLGELDRMTIRLNAAREAHGYQMQGQFARQAGKNQAAAYNNASIGTLLSGAGDLLGIYRAYGLNKTPNPAVKRANDALNSRGGVSSLVRATPSY